MKWKKNKEIETRRKFWTKRIDTDDTEAKK